jgi:hypothetical protein
MFFAGMVVVGVSFFLPWYDIRLYTIDKSLDGFHGWGWLSAVALVALIFLTAAHSFPKALPIGRKASIQICSIALLIGVLLFLWDGFATPTSAFYHAGPAAGAYVALLGSVATLYGSFKREEFK